MIARLAEGVRLRTLIALSVLLVLFIAAPLAASDYLLTVLTLILYFAYTGQAWNIMISSRVKALTMRIPWRVSCNVSMIRVPPWNWVRAIE